MMVYLSIALASALGLMLTAKIALLVYGIRRNQKIGQQLRDELWLKVEALPLHKMLASRRLEPRAFLNDQRVVSIERQLRTCAGCVETPRCLAVNRSAADWTFCPIEDEVSQLVSRAA